MMLSAHNNVSEDSEKWSHLRFTHQLTDNVSNLNDLSSSEDEQQPPVAGPQSKTSDHFLQEDGLLRSPTSTDDVVLKRTTSLEKRVSFPLDETKLVSHFSEPQTHESVTDCLSEEPTCQNLVDIYQSACKKNITQPIENIIEQLKNLDLDNPRSASLTLRGLTLGPRDCESLEDVLKQVPLKLLDLGASFRSDDGLIALFDMIEFYEAASHVSFAAHKNMTTRGWQACCRMIKRTECLEWLDAAQIGLSEHSSTLLAKALRADSYLRVLQLNGCSLSGRPITIIASSLRINRNLQELCLAENKLTEFDALQLGILLNGNNSLKTIDLRNNEIRDKGMVYLCDALLDNQGLTSLTVWNNGITHNASSSLNKVLATNRSLRTLNLGCNKLSDEGLMKLIPGGLEHNRNLHNLGLQANGLSCGGIISLAESLASGTQLQRVDLRKNSIQLAGLMALAVALKLCPTITCLDLDVKSSENSAEHDRLNKEINDLCAVHKVKDESSKAEEEKEPVERKFAHTLLDDRTARKESLTCPIPSMEFQLSKCPLKDEGKLQQVTKQKLRSPLPSPVASSGHLAGRFKVSQVDLTGSLPSTRSSSLSRFTVTPVSESSSRSFSGSSIDLVDANSIPTGSSVDSQIPSPPTDLIRRSPNKIVIGFDVVPANP